MTVTIFKLETPSPEQHAAFVGKKHSELGGFDVLIAA